MNQVNHKWTTEEFQAWQARHEIQRSYQDEVVQKIDKLADKFTVIKYGELSYDKNYPLYYLKTKTFNEKKPNILITGGVHGYETSGVQGALKFLNEYAKNMEDHYNFVCFPCISPWGYETINRWNPKAIDPNRNFYKDSPAQECKAIFDTLQELNLEFLAHFDLHETTDTDNTVFRPDLEKRDQVPQEVWDIPDGFYLVADSSRKTEDFQEAIISNVEQVTHIAPADKSGRIIGEKLIARGTINYDVKKLFLCAGLTDAPYVTTTEVYPDSPKVSNHECNAAQVAAIMGGLKFLRR